MRDARLRIFVNERPVDVAPGATVGQAVEALDQDLGGLLSHGKAYVTDGVGRMIDAADLVGEAGAVFRVVVAAGRGAPVLSKENLRRWPKAELHVHLDGSLRPATMLELAREQHVPLPADTPDALARAMAGMRAKSLAEYLAKYDLTLAVMQTAAALERIAYELVVDSAAEQVRYLEVRYSPLLHQPALSLSDAIEAPLRGCARAAVETGTKVGLIVCAIRSLPPSRSVELAHVAGEYRSAGLVGFDLAGPERGYPAEEHRAAFAAAREEGLACTCHAGEADGPNSIRQALDACGAQRIAHGTRLEEDPGLLARVIEQRIPLEMCLTSNLHTGTVASLGAHPLRRYLEQGVVVTLSTDARLVNGVSLTDEYHLAHTVLGLGRDELVRLVLNACESAFLPEFERVALVARMESELENIT